MNKRVFLSYAHGDREFARSLAEAIARQGLAVVDPAIEVESGMEWARQIKAAISDADATIVVLPISGSHGANNIFFELGAARALEKPVFAVSPDRASSEERQVPSSLIDVLVMDAKNKPPEAVANTLVKALEAA